MTTWFIICIVLLVASAGMFWLEFVLWERRERKRWERYASAVRFLRGLSDR